MQWRTSGRRLLAAAAAAVAIHLLLAIGLSLWPAPPPVTRRREPPLVVTIQERSGSPGSSAPAPGSSAPARAPPASSAQRSPSPAAPHAPRTRSTPTTGLAQGPGSDNRADVPARAADRGPLTKEEVAGEGLAHEPGDRRAGTTLRDPLATLNPLPPEPKQGPVHIPTREEALIEEKTRVEAMLHGWTDDYQAVNRAEGPHDAYWHDMQEALAKNFEVAFDVSKRENNQPTSNLREAAAAYQRAAETFGRTGSPVAGADRRSLNQSMSSGAVSAGDRGFAADQSLGGIKAAADEQALAGEALAGGMMWNKKLVVVIQIVQDPDGKIAAAQVAETSGNKAYDGTALAQVRKLAGKGVLGTPPSGRRRTFWAFETDFSTMPPLPIGGCALDALFVPAECYYPLKRTVRTRIHLQAIY